MRLTVVRRPSSANTRGFAARAMSQSAVSAAAITYGMVTCKLRYTRKWCSRVAPWFWPVVRRDGRVKPVPPIRDPSGLQLPPTDDCCPTKSATEKLVDRGV
jgi:hypothetical protein